MMIVKTVLIWLLLTLIVGNTAEGLACFQCGKVKHDQNCTVTKMCSPNDNQCLKIIYPLKFVGYMCGHRRNTNNYPKCSSEMWYNSDLKTCLCATDNCNFYQYSEYASTTASSITHTTATANLTSSTTKTTLSSITTTSRTKYHNSDAGMVRKITVSLIISLQILVHLY